MEANFLEEADQEMSLAFQWYENQVVGLGYAFLNAVDAAIAVIKTFPFAFECVRGNLRKSLLRRFPYGLIYGIDDGTIIIVAVAHSKMLPGYWINRIKKP
ncbi:MAG: type II toxin-antitoxin system RelE/ParE family toxin [Kiritimatiellae bacterium]|nr:type II toxin-antitoxin system RelE/ParE family toxin [Kiritimatiellia bacterium]